MADPLASLKEDLVASLPPEEAQAPVESNALKSFGRGIARGALGPLLDLYYRAGGEENYVRAQDDQSPIAEGAGQLTGLVGGAIASGGTGAAAKLGGLTVGGLAARAGAATGKALAPKLGGSLGARIALGGITNAAEGAVAGLAEGSSAAALDREAGLPGVTRHIMEGVGYGAALGGGIGALGTAFYRTNNWLFRKAFDPAIKEASKAKKALEIANRQRAALEDELANLDAGLPSKNPALSTDARRTQILGWDDPTVPGGMKQREVGGRMTYRTGEKDDIAPELWKAQRDIEDANKVLSDLTGEGASKLSQLVNVRARALINNGVGTAVATAGAGPIGGLLLRQAIPGYFVAIADHVLDGLGKFPMVRQAIGRSIKAGELTLDKFHINPNTGRHRRIAAGMVQDTETGALSPATKGLDKYIDDILAAKKSLKLAPVHHMTTDDYNEIVEEFNTTDIGQYEMQTRLQLMANGVPQEAINGHVEHQLRIHQYIKSKLPSPRGDQFITPNGDRLMATDAERIALSRRLRSAMLPETVMSDFLMDRLTPEAAEAFWATNPDMAQVVATEVEKLVNLARTSGVTLSPKRMQQVALLLNQPNKAGRLYNPNMVKLLQDNYLPKQPASPQAQPGGGGYKPIKLDGVSNAAMTSAELIAQRMAGPR